MSDRWNCVEEQSLLDYILGELSSEQSAVVRSHLLHCQNCRTRRDELAKEFQDLSQLVKQEAFLSSERIHSAKENFDRRVADYEQRRHGGWDQGYSAGWPRGKWIAAAAAVVLCVAAGALLGVWGWRTPEAGPPEAPQVLAKARGAEEALASRPLVQKLQVEFVQIQPAEDRLVRQLEVWTDPTARRFASRWLDSEGVVRHAVWSPAPETDFLFVYDPGQASGEILKTSRSISEESRLFGLGNGDLSCEALAEAFVRWLETRSWRPILLTDGVRHVDDAGLHLTIEEASTAARRGLLRLSAERRTEHGSALITLDIDSETYQPRLLRIRLERGGELSEIRIAARENQVVSPASLSPAVFEPRLPEQPDPSKDQARRRSGFVGAAAPSRSVTRPTLQELAAEELRIRYAIHRAEACVGNPLEIETNPSTGLTVKGMVNSDEAKSRLVRELSERKRPEWVKLEIFTLQEAMERSQQQEPARSSLGVESIPTEAQAPPRSAPVVETRPPIQDDLEKYLADRPLPNGFVPTEDNALNLPEKIMAFTDRAVGLSDEALAEAWALRNLAERYGDVSAGDLTPTGAEALSQMLQDHFEALREKSSQIRRAVLPLLEQIAAERGLETRVLEAGLGDQGLPTADLGAWDSACLKLFETSDVIHRNITALFAVRFQPSSGRNPRALDVDRTTAELLHAVSAAEMQLSVAERSITQLSDSAGLAPARIRSER